MDLLSIYLPTAVNFWSASHLSLYSFVTLYRRQSASLTPSSVSNSLAMSARQHLLLGYDFVQISFRQAANIA